MYFQRSWCEVIDVAPAGMTVKRGWDLAATPATGINDPDWTVGTKMGRTAEGRYVVLDNVRLQGSPHDVERLVYNTATADGRGVAVDLPQDPGQAGKSQVISLTRQMAGFTVRSSPETGDKITRFGPFSSQAEAGNVLVLRGTWNERWATELESFPTGAHDDDADATSRVFNALMQARPPMRISDEAVLRALRRDD
jgi:predicted phage terminase large subunit-like protein